jgi:hypothetical protein
LKTFASNAAALTPKTLLFLLGGGKMSNFARAHNQYLDPPDDDPVCEGGCGEAMTRDLTGVLVCENKFCPLRWDNGTVEREMAEMLIGAQETVKSMMRRYARVTK